MLKGLFLLNDFPPVSGGQSAYYAMLCRALPPQDVVVLAPACAGSEAVDRDLPFKVIRHSYVFRIPVLGRALKVILPVFFAASVIRREKIARLHCGHVLSSGVAGWILARLFRLPYVIYIHGADILEFESHPVLGKVLRSVLAGAARVVANSRFTAEQLVRIGVASGKVTVLNPRIDARRWTRVPPALGPGVSFLTGKRFVLSVGRLVARKGFDVMLAAWPRVRAAVPEACYVIAGSGPDRARLERLAGPLIAAGMVYLLPEAGSGDIEALMGSCEFLAMPSRYIREQGDVEGFGIVYLEANAAGKAVVAGQSGGVPDAVVDGKTGLLVDPEDAAAVAAAVIRLLQDPALARQMGAVGRERVLREFDISNAIPEGAL